MNKMVLSLVRFFYGGKHVMKRDCNIAEYEGVKDVKISLVESDYVKTYNLESKSVRFDLSVDSIGFRSISGHVQDDQLSDSSVFLSSETFQMTGIFRDINQGTEHNLRLGIIFKNISNDIGTFIGSGKCVEIL